MTIRTVVVSNGCAAVAAMNAGAHHAEGKILLFFGDLYLMEKNRLYLHMLEQMKGDACVFGHQQGYQLTSLLPIGRHVIPRLEYP